jgi:RimJ/RimL family protein N-acetyltransferase/acyl carrier protein
MVVGVFGNKNKFIKMSFLTLNELQLNLINIKPGLNFQNSDIYFEKLNLSGLSEMHEYSINEKFYEYFEFEAFKSIDETKEYLQKLISRMCTEQEYKPAMYWFIRRSSDNKLLGTAGLVNLNFSRKSVEWGYGIDPLLWGGGYILQIQEALKYYVFESLSLNRLEGITMINNERTIQTVKAAGMQHEGIIREYYCKDGSFIDGWKYSMLKNDFLKLNTEKKRLSNEIPINAVIDVVQSILEDEVINAETDITNAQEWDSISHMNIIVAIYTKFGIQFTPSQVAKARSVMEIYKIVNNGK